MEPNRLVVGVRPERGEFKAVACFALFRLAGCRVFDGVKPGAVGIVFGVCAVRDDKNLHILKQARACPKAVALIAINLIECLPNGNAPAF